MGIYYRLLNHTKHQFIDPDSLSLDGSWNSIKRPGFMYGCGSLCLSYLLDRASGGFSWIGDKVEWVGDVSEDYHCEDSGYTDISKQVAAELNDRQSIPIKYEGS